MIQNKKAMELAVNVVVMLIIGIILFGLGMALFSQFSSSGNEQVEDLSRQVKTDLGKLECRNSQWICSPTLSLGLGEKETTYVYVVNKDNTNKEFQIDISSSSMDRTVEGNKIIFDKNEECGSIVVAPFTDSLSVASGEQVGFPVVVFSTRTAKTGCSFTLLASIENQDEKTPMIINVE